MSPMGKNTTPLPTCVEFVHTQSDGHNFHQALKLTDQWASQAN